MDSSNPGLPNVSSVAALFPSQNTIGDLSDNIPPYRFITAKLSASSINLLKKAKMNNLRAETLRMATQKAYLKERADGLPNLTGFAKLPTELKDEIWKWYAVMEPRVVDIAMGMDTENFTGWGRNNVVTLYQINRQTRAESMSVHGYVTLKHATRDVTWLYNPSVDILLLNEKSLRQNGLSVELVVQTLEQGNILDEVRFIVLDAPSSRHVEWMTSFKKLSALEVVLIVLGQCHITEGGRGTEDMEDEHCMAGYAGGYPGINRGANKFRFEIIRRSSPFRLNWEMCNGPLDEGRAILEGAAARGSDRTVPLILFVRQVWIHAPDRYWYM
ncbi:hypothetical protein BUE80_DR002638 [Diplocarpon rosae]|nr:hypothetical protein BUE80_DR002638 [Diplocarpon rosae]